MSLVHLWPSLPIDNDALCAFSSEYSSIVKADLDDDSQSFLDRCQNQNQELLKSESSKNSF
ncbi:unnamed protein product [Clavelina lepadiformis]|uniref:Uncharacterized protein n=1 Tax=Clavelina lepadiformis TaxID=159417 RepID=A0ABP0FHE6_CLALP